MRKGDDIYTTIMGVLLAANLPIGHTYHAGHTLGIGLSPKTIGNLYVPLVDIAIISIITTACLPF